MRALIAAVAAALVMGAPAFGQTATPPADPPAAAAPAPGEFATDVRSLGRSTGDREVEEVMLHALPVIISPVRGRTEQVTDIVRAGLAELRAAMRAAGLTPAGHPMTVYLEIGDTDFSAELMIPVAQAAAAPPPGMRAGRSPDGKAVRIVHPGSYEELNDTYDQLSTFIEDQDLQVRDLVIERYLNDPDDVAPDDLRTEVYVLIR